MNRVRSDRLVFPDEFGFNQAMATMTGWSPRGERLLAHGPVNWGGNLAVVGAIRAAGVVVCHHIVRGAFNAERFVAFARDRLTPRLRAGNVVVLDNLRAHEDERVVQAFQAVGARLLFLPPYSPDLTPIEPMWGFAKTRVRAVAARTADGVRLAGRGRDGPSP